MENNPSRSLSGSPAEGDEARWLELVGQLDAATLTESFLTLVQTIPGYDPPPIPFSEIRRTGRLSFDALLFGLADGGFAAPVAVASDVGVSRARAGVPITSLISAIRLDFSILWEALASVARPSDAELIVRHTGIVLQTVDDYAGQTQYAYAAERQRMRDEESSVRRGLIASLLEGPAHSNDRLQAMASELELTPDEPLLVAAATGEDIAALRVFIFDIERAGSTVFSHHLGDSLIVFARKMVLPGSRIELVRERLATLRVGLTAAEAGLSNLRQAGANARDLARLLGPDDHGPITWESGWARLTAQVLVADGRPVIDDVTAALSTCGAAERARLEEAVRSYLRTGNVGHSAEELFCHRNTLANRLNRFAELTGIHPAVPEQAARLVVGWA